MPTKPALKPGITTTVAPDALNFYHRNARRGDIPAIARSLKRLNQYKPLTGNIGTHTGRPNEVLAGNHTLAAIRVLRDDEPAEPRWQEVKVHWVDVDDELAKEINLADNRTAELGGYDTAELVALLGEVPAVDLSAIGYTPDDLSDLRALIEESTADLSTVIDPRQQDDGLIRSNDITTDGEGYPDEASRMIVLVMPIPQFIWAQEQLQAVRTELGLDTNAEAFLALLSERCGQPVALADAEVVGDTSVPGEDRESRQYGGRDGKGDWRGIG